SMTNGTVYTLAYTISAVMMGVCIVLALVTKPLSEAKVAELKKA
ncbi:oxalate:formate antiporter, partial [Vibrio vulnificus]